MCKELLQQRIADAKKGLDDRVLELMKSDPVLLQYGAILRELDYLKNAADEMANQEKQDDSGLTVDE